MPLTFNVARADVSLESTYAQPDFGLFRDTTGLVGHLFGRLQPHGLRTQDVKIERGDGSVADFRIACHLFNYRLGVLVRTEKVESACLNVLEGEVEQFAAVTIDALSAVKEHQPSIVFRSHTVAVTMHGALEGASTGDYLSRFATNIPSGLGPLTGCGGVMYFGTEGDRILSSVTVDLSGVVPGGLFVRAYAVWDASKVEPSVLPARVRAFVRRAVEAFGLDVPTLGF